MADDPVVDHIFNVVTAEAWHAAVLAQGMLPFWVVRFDTVAYPGIYHARAWWVVPMMDGSMLPPVAYPGILVAPTLDVIRSLLPDGLDQIALSRESSDLVEMWLS